MGSTGSNKIVTREDRLNALSEYQYHATTAKALIGIYNEGLKPNRGELGRGVYFSDTQQRALDWMPETTGGDKVLRVKTSYLRDNTDYDAYDDTQGMTTKRIPRREIEILNRSGEWESLEDYAKRYYRSFGIRR